MNRAGLVLPQQCSTYFATPRPYSQSLVILPGGWGGGGGVTGEDLQHNFDESQYSEAVPASLASRSTLRGMMGLAARQCGRRCLRKASKN